MTFLFQLKPEVLREKAIVLRSKRTIRRLKSFVCEDGPPEAEVAYNDDLVIPLAIGVYLRDTTLTFMKQGQDLSRATIAGFTKPSSFDGVYSPHNPHNNPWKMDDGRGGQHDLDWLLK